MNHSPIQSGRPQQHGFTLIELLIVMGILSGRLIKTFLGLLTNCIKTRKVITQTMQKRLKSSLRHR